MAADGRNWGVERAEVNVDGFDHDSKRQREAALHPATISHTTDIERATSRGIWQSLRSTFHRYNLETRGIERVLPEERHNLKKLGFVQIGLLWFGVNLAANNITLGMLGPTIFYLSFLDASLCAIFGMLVGCLPVAYVATFGPRSGLRSMILARFSFGWYPAKILVILNIVVLLGYSLLDCVIAGQIMSAVSPNGRLSVIVGIVITAVISWLITTFGYGAFHMYERYAWLPQLIVISILAGVAGPHFDLYSNPSVGETSATVIGSRISFFSLNLAAAVTYSGGAADLFVYYPEESPRWKVFATTMIGLALSFAFALLVGIGLGSGVAANTTWSEAYSVSQGALIVQGLSPVGTFGSFCSIIIALGLVSNMVLPIYAAGIDFQALNSYFAKVPRVVWNAISCIIFTVCAIAGRAHLAAIFTNFLALMGYWVVIWIAIMLEEHLIFRKFMSSGWNWDAWNDRKLLPVGYAAFVAFLVGWAGAIISMAQVWYIGPLAARIGDYGADLGNFVAFAWAGLVYPPLRWLEVRHSER